MIRIRPVGVTNMVEVELSDGTVYGICEYHTGKLVVFIPATPGSSSVTHSPLHFHRVADIEEVEISPSWKT